MAVDLASPAGGGGRIYGPVNFDDESYIFMPKDKYSQFLAKIERVYSRVKLDDKDSTSHNGFCFGLLDPASNIIVNVAIVSATAAVAAPLPRSEGSSGGQQHRGMIQRSLDGLVAFLTYLFPYLLEAEATAYLAAAGADPLAAALLIIDRRGLRSFGFCSGATMAAVEIALRCAAAASNHPDPQQLVTGWKLLSPCLKNLVSELSRSRTVHDGIAIVRNMLTTTKVATDVLQLEQSWELASSRCVSPKPESLPPVRGAMKRVLLSTIHGFYLQALAMMPTAELTTRYHRSLLMGGYCYGPLDPVSNIIVNTIWYEETFPTRKQAVTLNMISRKCLSRVVARSFYGLISFLCTRYPGITPDLAMQRLLLAGADLQAADPNFHDATTNKLMKSWSCCLPLQCGRPYTREAALEGRSPSASLAEPYFAAATAAFHANPLVQKEFLGSTDALPKLKVASEALQDGRQLTSKDLEFISTLLCPSAGNSIKQQEPPPPLKLKKWRYPNAVQCVSDFWEQHERVSEKVKAALDTYNKNTKQSFELHIICGVNELVGSRLLHWGIKRSRFNPMEPSLYHRSHVNFLAVPKGKPSATVLFFAQYNNYEDGNNYDKDEDSSYLCVPMNLKDAETEQIRCIYCDKEGRRIVHPIREGFCGRDKEFEKVLLGDSKSMKECYENDTLIRGQIEDIEWVHDLEDDFIYTEFFVDEDDNGGPEVWVRHMPMV